MSHYRVIKHGSPTPTPAPSSLPLGSNIASLDYFQNNIVASDLSHGSHTQSMPSGAEVPAANLDANRWAQTLPGADTKFRYSFQPPEASGQIAVTFTPNVAATITGFQCTINASNLVAGTATVTPTYIQPTGNGWSLDFTFSGSPKITSMSAKPVGDSSTYGANFLAQMASTTATGSFLRPMDMTGVNFNQGVHLSSTTGTFPTPFLTSATRNTLTSGDWLPNDSANGGRINDGVPVEFLVAMANAANRNLWLNLPWNADNTYYDAIADYVAANLTLTAYFEVANEVWNSGFWVHNQARFEAESEGLLGVASGTATGDRANERLIEKTITVMDRIKARYAAASKTNYKRVFAMHNADGPGGYAALFLDYAPPSKTALKNHIDVIASAPYFGNTLDGAPINTGTDATVFFNWGFGEVDTTLDYAARIQSEAAARTNDLGAAITYACYEWGQSFYINDATTRDSLQHDSRMYDLYMYAAGQVQARLGNIVVNHFENAGPNSVFGSWGALEASNEAITSARPKAKALKDYVAGTRKLVTLAGTIQAPQNAAIGAIVGTLTRRTLGSTVGITTSPVGVLDFVNPTANPLQVKVINNTSLTPGQVVNWTVTEALAADPASPHTTTGSFTVTGSSTTYLDYRVLCLSLDGPAFSAAEISLAETIGGTNVAPAQTYSDSSHFSSSTTADKAFDSNLSTAYTSSTAAGGVNEWVRITLASAKAVNELKLTARDAASGAANQTPRTGKLQASANGGSTWVDIISFSTGPWVTGSEVRTFVA